MNFPGSCKGSTLWSQFTAGSPCVLTQSQVGADEQQKKKKKGSGEGSGGSGRRARSGSTGFRRRFRRRSGRLWCSRVRFSRAYGNPAGVFPALGFAARFRKNCENKTLWLLGILPKLIKHYLGAQCLFKNTLMCAPFILSPANSHALSLSLSLCLLLCVTFSLTAVSISRLVLLPVWHCMVDMLRIPPLTCVRNSEVCYKVSCRYSILLHAHVQDVHPWKKNVHTWNHTQRFSCKHGCLHLCNWPLGIQTHLDTHIYIYIYIYIYIHIHVKFTFIYIYIIYLLTQADSKQTDRPTDRLAGRPAGRLAGRPTGRPAGRRTGRTTDRRIHTYKIPTYLPTCLLTYLPTYLPTYSYL